MITPQAPLNARAIRAEQSAQRIRLSALCAAAALAGLALLLAHMALTTALALPELAAQSVERTLP